MSKKSKKYIDEYLDETETSKTGDKQAENNDSNDNEVRVEPKRDSKGRFKPGCTGNPNGRPPAGSTIVEEFRDNPKGLDVIRNVINVASTFGTDGQHRDAVSAVKLVIERLVPALKSSEIHLDTTDDKGYVFMPEQKPAKKDGEEQMVNQVRADADVQKNQERVAVCDVYTCQHN